VLLGRSDGQSCPSEMPAFHIKPGEMQATAPSGKDDEGHGSLRRVLAKVSRDGHM